MCIHKLSYKFGYFYSNSLIKNIEKAKKVVANKDDDITPNS